MAIRMMAPQMPLPSFRSLAISDGHATKGAMMIERTMAKTKAMPPSARNGPTLSPPDPSLMTPPNVLPASGPSKNVPKKSNMILPPSLMPIMS